MGVVNKTLQELGAFDKPTLTIFNKMDLYESQVFDEWLDDEVKKDMLTQLETRWQQNTNSHAIFVSATERRNLDGLRNTVLNKVKQLYAERYPYLTKFY
jgi:GTP-binding protein HflX